MFLQDSAELFFHISCSKFSSNSETENVPIKCKDNSIDYLPGSSIIFAKMFCFVLVFWKKQKKWDFLDFLKMNYWQKTKYLEIFKPFSSFTNNYVRYFHSYWIQVIETCSSCSAGNGWVCESTMSECLDD